MSRLCKITGKRPLVGNNVSKSHRKTKSRQLPNLQTKKIFVPELNKFVHKLAEDGRIAIRNVRRDGIQSLHNFEKEGHVSEDLIKDNELEVQKVTDEMIKKLNQLQEEKEKEILEV